MDKLSEISSWQDSETFDPLELELKEFFSDLPTRTYREELLNTWSHGLFAFLSIFGSLYVMYCAIYSGQDYALLSGVVYSVSLIVLFSSSAFYHGAVAPLLKKKLRIMDHCAIFLFIAGNYTPILLLTVGGDTGWSLLYMQWTVAVFGILLKIKFTGKYDWFFILLFVIMAWVGIIQGEYLYQNLPTAAFNMLIIGGFVYMAGIFFYKAEGRIPYAHLIWHLFVMGGALIHYLVMVQYIF